MAVSIMELLKLANEKGASDLHLAVDLPPTIRLYGFLEKLDYPELSEKDIHKMVSEVLTEEQQRELSEAHEIDTCFEVADLARFRVNAFYERQGKGAAFRLIPFKIKSIDELGLPEVVARLAGEERGLVLVTGPTGSGKTTTLASMIDLINQQRSGHIVTIEDPIEFVHQHKKCIVHQREVGRHTNSFALALKSVLREDPDVILVGEMRDLDAILMTVTAAETGHLVLSTLHTSSAAQTVDRIIDVFPPHQQAQVRTQLAESLVGVVSQTLIPRLDKKGRVVATEVMVANAAIKTMIREGKTHQIPNAITSGMKEGMHTLDHSLTALVKEGKISEEEMAKRSLIKRFERSTI